MQTFSMLGTNPSGGKVVSSEWTKKLRKLLRIKWTYLNICMFNYDNALDIKCKLFEETFDKFVDLENHIEVCHEKQNVFQCYIKV